MSKARELASLGNAYSDGALSNRNLIINGAMQVAQRGTSFVDPNGYTLDRFPVFGTVDVSRISGFSNFQYAMRITGKTGNTIAIGQQRIEGLNAAHLTGKSVTLSFYAKASTPITVGWSAATANSYDNFGASTNFGTGTFSVTTTETRYTVTIDNVPSSCANGILITFSPNNYGAFTSGTFDITGVSLEVGDTATPFEHRSYGQELALCQRYFWNIGGASGVGKAWQMFAQGRGANGNAFCVMNHPVQMRANPTVTMASQSDGFWFNDSINGATGGTIVVDQASPLNTSMTFVRASGPSMNSGYACTAYRNSSANCVLSFDAEL